MSRRRVKVHSERNHSALFFSFSLFFFFEREDRDGSDKLDPSLKIPSKFEESPNAVRVFYQ